MRGAAVAMAAAVLVLAGPAIASGAVQILRGQSVDDVRVIGEDVHVDGRVRNSLIVVGGDLIVGGTGTVNDATIIGGRLRLEPGGRIGDEVFQLGRFWPQFDAWPTLLTLGFLLLLRTVVVWLVVALAGLLAGRRELTGVVAAARSRPLRTLAVGSLAALSVSAASVLLALTLLGLVLAAALWGLLLLAAVVGVAFVLRAETSAPRVRRLTFATLALPLLGDGLLALAAAVGLGALLRFTGGRVPSRTSEHTYAVR